MRRLILAIANILVWVCPLMAQQTQPSIHLSWSDPWWEKAEIVGELHLSESQISNIEQIVQAYKRDQMKFKRNLDPIYKQLSPDPLNDESILRWVDIQAKTLAVLEKQNYLAALSIRKIISAEQWRQLIRIMELNWRQVFKKSIKQPKIVSKTKPIYAANARLKKIEGTVIVEAIVHTDGAATVTRVIKGLGYGLDESVTESVNKYRFKPATIGGEPIECVVHVDVNFSLY
jgi:TonB family protein